MKHVENAVVLTVEEYEELSKAAKKASHRKVRKEPMRIRNRVLILLGLFVLAFIITMIVVFCMFGAVPDTLIQYTLGAGGVEAVALAAITISEKIKGGKE